MLPKPTAKYVGMSPLSLARLSHQFEDDGNDVDFLAVQDAVGTLTESEQVAFRKAYIEMHSAR